MDINIIFYAVFGALGYVLLQSLFILGIRIAAKGGTEILPDGSEKDSEMILYPVFKYLTRVKKTNVYYSGTAFDQLIGKLRIQMPEASFVSEGNSIHTVSLKALHSTLAGIDKKIQTDLSDGVIRFYITNETFKVNKYFRKPVIQCPICMASYWSVISYWIPMVYFFGWSFWVIYCGVINICAVACMNWLLWMRGNADESKILKG